MYTSPDDARSDLFLSAAVYLFGPLVLGTLLGVLPLPGGPITTTVLALAIPFAVTVLVPWLLVRYRKEPLSAYGLGGLRLADFGLGAFLAAPFVAASFLILAVLFGDLGARPWEIGAGGGLVAMLSKLVRWVGLCLLGVFATVKARDAFRQDYITVREGLRDIGRWVVLVAGGALLLLVFSRIVRGEGWESAVLLLLPLALAGALALALRSLRGPSVTSRQVLLTPTVLFALGPFALSLSGQVFLSSLYQAALSAGVGLLVGALVEVKRSAWAPIGLGAAIALLTLFDAI